MRPLTTEDSGNQTRADEIKQLDLLIGRIQGTSQYKAINMIPGLNKTERSLLDRIITKSFQLYGDKKGELVMDTILSTLIDTKIDAEDDYS